MPPPRHLHFNSYEPFPASSPYKDKIARFDSSLTLSSPPLPPFYPLPTSRENARQDSWVQSIMIRPYVTANVTQVTSDLVSDFWFPISDFWFLISDIWFLIFYFQFLISDFLFPISDFWFLISDFRFGNLGFLIFVHGKSVFWFFTINLKNTLRVISDFRFLEKKAQFGRKISKFLCFLIFCVY